MLVGHEFSAETHEPVVDLQHKAPYTRHMAATSIGTELVEQIARDLAERYSLDAASIREVGRRLAGEVDDRSRENIEFADRFMKKHQATFDRLAR